MFNSGPGTVTSDFFFNVEDNTSTLGTGYSVFGNITSGVDVVQQMLAAPVTCTSNGLIGSTIDCLPQPDITITDAAQTR